jgi:hypothetical protein
MDLRETADEETVDWCNLRLPLSRKACVYRAAIFNFGDAYNCVRFEVFMAVIMKNILFWGRGTVWSI